MELAIIVCVAVVALATWDVFRRRYDARKVDDREAIEQLVRDERDAFDSKVAAIAKEHGARLTQLEHRLTQNQNRAPVRRLNKL